MFSWGFPDTQAVHVRFPVMTRHPITLSEAAEPLSLPNSVFARIVLFVGTCNLKEQLPLHDCALVCRGWYNAVRATHSVLCTNGPCRSGGQFSRYVVIMHNCMFVLCS